MLLLEVMITMQAPEAGLKVAACKLLTNCVA